MQIRRRLPHGSMINDSVNIGAVMIYKEFLGSLHICCNSVSFLFIAFLVGVGDCMIGLIFKVG
jgi:hypothetical protein